MSYIPHDKKMKEFTIKAIILGAIFSAVFAIANSYLAIKAGMTVAACFPGAVIAMAVLRPFKGTILEENLSRTAISAGESLAAGFAFTIPALLILNIWTEINYLTSTIIAMLGGLLGVCFVSILRKMLVNNAELPFPESIATAAIVKSGQKGATGAKYMFGSMVVGIIRYSLKCAIMRLWTKMKLR